MQEAHDDDADSINEAAISPVRRGHRLGRYILCYELASGGMATVYLGRATGVAGFEKLVALKIIHPHLAKEKDFVDMFLDEARIVARINHPNVCSVFDFGKEEDTYFLAMEYLVGETCSRFARSLAKRPDLHERYNCPLLMAYVLQQACEGLHAAHELKGDDGQLLEVVHRDMTPQNLFIGYDGSVRVVDFGVASAIGRMHQTSAGTLKGKFAYMSPEQVRQEKVDRRGDVWSLGVSLWELLTRRRLFKRDGEYETLRAVIEDPIPAPSDVRPGLPSIFDEIVARALQRELPRRYTTAREMGRDLGKAIGQLGGASSADLADLMEELFAKEQSEREDLLERARTLDPEQQSTSQVMVASVIATDPSASSEMSMPSRTVAAAMDSPGRTRPRLWALAAFSAALLGVITIGAALGWPSGPEETIALGSPEEPQAAEEPPEVDVEPPTEPPGDGPPPDVETLPAEPPQEEPPQPEDAPPEEVPPQEEVPSEPVATEGRRSPRGESGGGRSGRSAEREPVGSGTVSIVTPPGWAEIYEGRRHIGRSPTEVRLPAGSHRIRVMPYGEGPAISRRINVENGGTSRLVIRLED